jgi:hypothetical protein
VSGYLIGIIIVVLAVLLHRLFSARAARIESPVLGFLNLSGEDGAEYLEEDRTAFGPLFKSIQESDFQPPVCNVLFIYGVLESDGRIRESAKSLGEIISQAGACVVIVATGNDSASCTAALKETPAPGVNLMMTLAREDQVFPRFYKELFAGMMRGISMPVMWNRLAPQYPGAEHSNVPGSFGLMGAGQVSFR